MQSLNFSGLQVLNEIKLEVSKVLTGQPWTSSLNTLETVRYCGGILRVDQLQLLSSRGDLSSITKIQKPNQMASIKCCYTLYKTFFLIEGVVHATEFPCTLQLQDLEAVLSPRQPNHPTWNLATCAESNSTTTLWKVSLVFGL